jgi:hypothetical protein
MIRLQHPLKCGVSAAISRLPRSGPHLALKRRWIAVEWSFNSPGGNMKSRILGAVIAPVLALGLAACSVEQTEEGEMPDVDVDAGQMPEYDVQPADVDVGWDTTTVRTPTIDINEPEDTIPTN